MVSASGPISTSESSSSFGSSWELVGVAAAAPAEIPVFAALSYVVLLVCCVLSLRCDVCDSFLSV